MKEAKSFPVVRILVVVSVLLLAGGPGLSFGANMKLPAPPAPANKAIPRPALPTTITLQAGGKPVQVPVQGSRLDLVRSADVVKRVDNKAVVVPSSEVGVTPLAPTARCGLPGCRLIQMTAGKGASGTYQVRLKDISKRVIQTVPINVVIPNATASAGQSVSESPSQTAGLPPVPSLSASAGPILPLIKASAQQPPELQKMFEETKQMRTAPSAKRLTVQELKMIIQNQPGGPEKLAQANEGMAQYTAVPSLPDTISLDISNRFASVYSPPPYTHSFAAVAGFTNTNIYPPIYLQYNNNGYLTVVNSMADSYAWPMPRIGCYYLREYGYLHRYLYINIVFPSTGYYILDLYAFGSFNGILRSSLIDMSVMQVGGYHWNHYVYMLFVEKGRHNFTFECECQDPREGSASNYSAGVASITIERYR